jgi:phytoene synthase
VNVNALALASDAASNDIVAASHTTLAVGSKTFRFASHLLPRDCRDDAAVVYSFCRLVDDLADEAESPERARIDLERVRAELRGDAAVRPLISTYLAVCRRRGIDLRAAEQLLDGVMSDLVAVRVADDAALLRYCYRVASTVGLMMCGVLGVSQREALPHAIDLGIAMQLTNICRDVADDARMGRVYLPESRLQTAGTTQDRVLAGQFDASTALVIADLLELADRYYRSADAGMRFIPARARAAIMVASRTYRAIGTKLIRRGCDASRGRVVVGLGAKIGLALLALGAMATPRVLGAARAPHEPTLHWALRGLPGANAEPA